MFSAVTSWDFIRSSSLSRFSGGKGEGAAGNSSAFTNTLSSSHLDKCSKQCCGMRIRDILVRIRGSVPLSTNGSGSCYFSQWPSKWQLKLPLLYCVNVHQVCTVVWKSFPFTLFWFLDTASGIREGKKIRIRDPHKHPGPATLLPMMPCWDSCPGPYSRKVGANSGANHFSAPFSPRVPEYR